ncbi:MAG: hypothetical protein IJH12_04820 [Clostridia bacterium]|nr:hypothetical protein [Clostridia bacterium]
MKIKCLICGDIIESKTTHDLVNCKCDNCYIDGGQNYLHFGGNNYEKILIIFEDGTEILASDDEEYRKKYEEWEEKKVKEVVESESFNN